MSCIPPGRRAFGLPPRRLPVPAGHTLSPSVSSSDLPSGDETDSLTLSGELDTGSGLVDFLGLGDTGAWNFVDHDWVVASGMEKNMFRLPAPFVLTLADGSKGAHIDFGIILKGRIGQPPPKRPLHLF